MKNHYRDKVFTCPKCGNKTLFRVDNDGNTLGLDYHDLCVCEECAAELYAEPQYDNTVKFVESENAY